MKHLQKPVKEYYLRKTVSGNRKYKVSTRHENFSPRKNFSQKRFHLLIFFLPL